MGSKITFEPNPKALEELLASSDAVDAMGEIAAVAGNYVRQEMPVGKTGNLKASIITDSGIGDDGRAQGAVGTTSSFWHFVEYGSATTTPKRPFSKAMENTGLDYEPLGR